MKIDINNFDWDDLEELPATAKIKHKKKIKPADEDSNSSETGNYRKKEKNERKEK